MNATSQLSTRPLVLVVACIFAAIGAVGLVSPDTLVAAMRVVLTPVGLYGIGALRIGMGLVLIWAAASSRSPRAPRARSYWHSARSWRSR